MLEILPQSITDHLFVNSEHRERDLDILEYRLKGSATLEALAEKHGISRSRVGQIECQGRRVINWHFRKLEEAHKKQGELLAAIKRLEAIVAAYKKNKEAITRHFFEEDEKETPVIPVADLKCPEMIPVRVYDALRNAGIKTLNEAAESLKKGDCRILRVHNFGKISLGQLKRLLAQYGLMEGPEASPERGF